MTFKLVVTDPCGTQRTLTLHEGVAFVRVKTKRGSPVKYVLQDWYSKDCTGYLFDAHGAFLGCDRLAGEVPQ